MGTIRQFTEDATSSFSKYVKPGKCAGLYLVFEGTNKTGQTGDFDDLGTLGFARNGETLEERKMGLFKSYWDAREGQAYLDSTTAGAFKAAVKVPFWLKGEPNAYNLKADEGLVSWEPASNIGTVFSDITVSIARIVEPWPERYLMRMMGKDQSVDSGWSSRKVDLSRNNIAEVLVRDSGSVLSKVGLRQNDDSIHDEETKSYYLGLTINDGEIEASTFDMLRLPVYSPDADDKRTRRASAINQNSELIVSASGSDTVEITTVSITPKKGVYMRGQ